jgi:hypothetical protein
MYCDMMIERDSHCYATAKQRQFCNCESTSHNTGTVGPFIGNAVFSKQSMLRLYNEATKQIRVSRSQ